MLFISQQWFMKDVSVCDKYTAPDYDCHKVCAHWDSGVLWIWRCILLTLIRWQTNRRRWSCFDGVSFGVIPSRQPGLAENCSPGQFLSLRGRAGCWFQGTAALPANSHMVAEVVHANKLRPAAGGRKPGNFRSGNVLRTSCGIVKSVHGIPSSLCLLDPPASPCRYVMPMLAFSG